MRSLKSEPAFAVGIVMLGFAILCPVVLLARHAIAEHRVLADMSSETRAAFDDMRKRVRELRRGDLVIINDGDYEKIYLVPEEIESNYYIPIIGPSQDHTPEFYGFNAVEPSHFVNDFGRIKQIVNKQDPKWSEMSKKFFSNFSNLLLKSRQQFVLRFQWKLEVFFAVEFIDLVAELI